MMDDLAKETSPAHEQDEAARHAGPLVGLRVLELDAIGPVPHCGMLLADMGADVVRVLRPGGQSAYADVGGAILHRGRTSVELDLKTEAGREGVLALVRHADALVEGMRPGVMERLGLGPDVCHALAPSLVYARATGWGQTGPLRARAGHDINYLALTGTLHALRGRDGYPQAPLNLVGDYAGGALYLAFGMVSAMLHARSTGKGQVLDAAIVDGASHVMGLFHALLASGQWREEPGANLLDGGAPFYRCYACACGGYVAVGALEPQFFRALLEGLALDPARFPQHERESWPALEEALAQAFAQAPRDHWEALFRDTDACVTPVLSMAEAMVHPVNAARGVFVERDATRQAAPAPRFSVTPGQIAEGRMLALEDALSHWRRR
ncbi:CaiB/BaiF CoA transferase family protein [Novosphingobium profundi]|uniref:CaiB/BaiF CoA transferase family protein n=1 Tax=Novosphingobium profundi TaxID=1774954 RepID=UPI001CFCAC85|nr:CaiB/BaiF CoA-transferase family protein [Novosphingobium profundi]